MECNMKATLLKISTRSFFSTWATTVERMPFVVLSTLLWKRWRGAQSWWSAFWFSTSSFYCSTEGSFTRCWPTRSWWRRCRAGMEKQSLSADGRAPSACSPFHSSSIWLCFAQTLGTLKALRLTSFSFIWTKQLKRNEISIISASSAGRFGHLLVSTAWLAASALKDLIITAPSSTTVSVTRTTHGFWYFCSRLWFMC